MVSLSKFIKKEIELRENLVGTGFLDPPTMRKEIVEKELYDQKNNKIIT
jgi:hypothetical protein